MHSKYKVFKWTFLGECLLVDTVFTRLEREIIEVKPLICTQLIGSQFLDHFANIFISIF